MEVDLSIVPKHARYLADTSVKGVFIGGTTVFIILVCRENH